VLSLDPLAVATGDGALELTRTEWRGEGAPVLQVGQRLDDSGPGVFGVQPEP
jgi:methionyl-tRNA formyltransferase